MPHPPPEPAPDASDAAAPDAGYSVIELAIPNDVRHIERVVALVQRECRTRDFARHQVMLNVPVALTEALSNAILRGNTDDPAKQVHVRAMVDQDQLVVEVQDEGTGFDLASVAIDPTTPDQIEREDGRGLFLMRRLMDRVEQFDAPHGSVIRMTLRRA